MDFQLKGRVIFFATDNIHKYNEGRRVLAEFKIAVGLLRVKAWEIQSDSIEEIAKTSVVETFRRCNLPVIVEDAGLFVDALNGFPGPYADYVFRTIRNKGLLKLMEKGEDRKARFHSVVAYCSAESKSPICFKGEVDGKIIEEERRGKHRSGFGFDPIFKPSKSRKTFAEMATKEKNKYSHRAQALREFAKWYTKSSQEKPKK